MSKRFAETQMGREARASDGIAAEDDVPRQATAAQLAARKIKSLKRPGARSSRSSHTPNPALQRSGFENINFDTPGNNGANALAPPQQNLSFSQPQQQNGGFQTSFSQPFGTTQTNGSSNPISSSFPPASAPHPQSHNFTPSSTSFSFTAGQNNPVQNNPFANMNGFNTSQNPTTSVSQKPTPFAPDNPTAGASGGFKGSALFGSHNQPQPERQSSESLVKAKGFNAPQNTNSAPPGSFFNLPSSTPNLGVGNQNQSKPSEHPATPSGLGTSQMFNSAPSSSLFNMPSSAPSFGQGNQNSRNPSESSSTVNGFNISQNTNAANSGSLFSLPSSTSNFSQGKQDQNHNQHQFSESQGSTNGLKTSQNTNFASGSLFNFPSSTPNFGQGIQNQNQNKPTESLASTNGFKMPGSTNFTSGSLFSLPSSTSNSGRFNLDQNQNKPPELPASTNSFDSAQSKKPAFSGPSFNLPPSNASFGQGNQGQNNHSEASASTAPQSQPFSFSTTSTSFASQSQPTSFTPSSTSFASQSQPTNFTPSSTSFSSAISPTNAPPSNPFAKFGSFSKPDNSATEDSSGSLFKLPPSAPSFGQDNQNQQKPPETPASVLQSSPFKQPRSEPQAPVTDSIVSTPTAAAPASEGRTSREELYTALNHAVLEHLKVQPITADWSDIMRAYLKQMEEIEKDHASVQPAVEAVKETSTSEANYLNTPMNNRFSESLDSRVTFATAYNKRKASDDLPQTTDTGPSSSKRSKPISSFPPTPKADASPDTGSETSSLMKSIIEDQNQSNSARKEQGTSIFRTLDKPFGTDVSTKSSSKTSTSNFFSSTPSSTSIFAPGKNGTRPVTSPDKAQAQAQSINQKLTTPGSLFATTPATTEPNTTSIFRSSPVAPFGLGAPGSSSAASLTKSPFGFKTSQPSGIANQSKDETPRPVSDSPFKTSRPLEAASLSKHEVGSSIGSSLFKSSQPPEAASSSKNETASSTGSSLFKPSQPSEATSPSTGEKLSPKGNSIFKSLLYAGTGKNKKSPASENSIFKPSQPSVAATPSKDETPRPAANSLFNPSQLAAATTSSKDGTPRPTTNSFFKPSLSAPASNFMTQFGEAAKKSDDAEREKRKLDDMDSDEDEAEWEKRDAENQAAKRAKLAEGDSQTPRIGQMPKIVNGRLTWVDSEQTKSSVPSKGDVLGDKSQSSIGDFTWKPDTPVKFGNSTTTQPTFQYTAPTPTKSIAQKTPNNSTLFSGNGNNVSPFKDDSAENSATGADDAKGTSTPQVGFSFAPTSSSKLGSNLFPPSTAPSPFASSGLPSRSSTPGLTTDGEGSVAASEGENENEETNEPQQDDLSGLLESEKEAEDVLLDVKAKIMEFKKADPDRKTTAGWHNRGQGPLRVLKNKETGIVRLLMRTSPAGQIVVNSRLLKEVQYKKMKAKTAQIAVVNKEGGLTSLMVRMGSDENVDQLVAVCEENKPNA